jgi:hypothetical protein
MDANDFIAIYAAFVATGALFLEMRRWAESGPRIVVTATPEMMIFGGGQPDENDLLGVIVYNRGDIPTTITGMIIVRFEPNWFGLRQRRAQQFVVTNPQPPGHPLNVPAELKPGGQWMGFGRPRPDLMPDIQNGMYWAGVHTTARDKPYLAKIPKRKPEPTGQKI